MTDYGLLRCIPNQIEANEGKSLVGKDEISISYLGEKGDSPHHDRGNMNIIVEKDGTVKVVDFYKGEKVEIENCEMNTEFGTDKLIPMQQAIDNAHEAAKQNKQQ